MHDGVPSVNSPEPTNVVLSFDPGFASSGGLNLWLSTRKGGIRNVIVSSRKREDQVRSSGYRASHTSVDSQPNNFQIFTQNFINWIAI